MSTRVGYVPGAWDLIHVGHLDLLLRAREQCDRLVVGVLADETVVAKGDEPVVPLAERLEVLGSLDLVDEVVADWSGDGREVWSRLRFDVLFQVEDWRGTPEGEQLEAELASVGVRVLYYPRTLHTSGISLPAALEHRRDRELVLAIRPRTAVVVAVPTYRRPADLAALLPMLLRQAGEVRDGGYEVRVLVVDNDPDGEARPVVDGFAPDVGYVLEREPGIAAARNRALDESPDADVLVMIDDDERPRPGWLTALLSTWTAERPALVAGRVVAQYEGELDPWIAAGDFFRRRSLATGTAITASAAGNVLLDLSQLRRAGLRFDARLGLGGGEDTLLTRQMHRRALRMLWCEESVVLDCVPAARMSRRWVLMRAWSHGNAAASVDLMCAESAGARLRARLLWLVAGVLRVVAGLGRCAYGAVLRSARDQARGLRTAMRGAGMVVAALGHRHQEYARGSAGG